MRKNSSTKSKNGSNDRLTGTKNNPITKSELEHDGGIPTFTAPNITVTDDRGLVSNPDSVTITITFVD